MALDSETAERGDSHVQYSVAASESLGVSKQEPITTGTVRICPSLSCGCICVKKIGIVRKLKQAVVRFNQFYSLRGVYALPLGC